MKTMKKLAIFALIATLFAACDIDRNPYSYYTKDQVTGDLDIMLNGCYASLKRWSDNMHYVGEFGGDNVMKQARSTDSWFQFISYMHMPTNSRMKNFWVDSYKVISQSSDLIKSFNEGESAETDQKIGEAYYLRGMAYFYLCRTFGRPYYQGPETNLGVPIVNGLPEDMDNLKLSDRATVKETYNQIIADLEKAGELMKSERRQAFATKGAAHALLSRVYLYMSGTYDNPNTEYADRSIYYADQVINSGTYELLNRANFSKLNEMAPDANSQTETIFAIKRVSSEFSTDDYFSCIGGMYSTIDGVGWGEVYASADIMDILYEAKGFNDARWSFIRPNYLSDNDAFRFVAKVFNDAGQHTGYTYYQGLVSEKNGALFVTVRDEEYPLTLLDEENKSYTVTFNGEKYHGYRGKEMVLSNGYPQFFIIKCSLQDGETQLHSPIVSRLAEMYLNKAEAYVKKGDYANALANVNIIRGRAITGGEYSNVALDKESVSKLVDKERRLEFAWEAHRTPDIYRLGQTLTRKYPGIHNQLLEVKATDDRVIQFIPADEINAYPGTLTQNP
jgi:hypothetical protein